MPRNNHPILVVCAHPDDETLGAGGTIAIHTQQGIPVDVLCLTGNKIRNAELTQASEILGVRKVLSHERRDDEIDQSVKEDIINGIMQSKPEVIITHSLDDYNRNHSLCAEIVLEAVEWASHKTQSKEAHRAKRVYHMEINSLITHPNVMVDISEQYEDAVQALRCHVSQMPKANSFYHEFYDARTKLRGVQAACERAEAFSISIPKHAGPFYPINSVRTLI